MGQSQSLESGTATSYPDINRGPLLLRTVWVLTSISVVVVAARFWSKWREVRRLYWDDVLMLLSLVRVNTIPLSLTSEETVFDSDIRAALRSLL